MARKTSEPRAGDDRNMSFELPESELEDLKPGIDLSEKKADKATEGEHDRLARADRKRIPQASLAERIRKAAKGA